MKKNLFSMSAAMLFGTLLFTGCSNNDNGPVLPEEDPMVAVEADFTDLVQMDKDSWNAGGTYAVNVQTTDGRTGLMVERYYGEFPCADKPLKQVVEGLEDGKYTVVLYATSNLAWIASDVEAGATDVAYVYATSGDMIAVEPIVAGRETGFSVPGEYSLDIEVAGGTLEIGLGLNKTDMTNWHTIQIKSLTMQKEVPLSEAYAEALESVELLSYFEMSAEAKAALEAAAAAPMTVENYNALIAAIKAVADDPVFKAYQVIANGVADGSLENWTCTNSAAFHINTWSGEGNDDGSEMKTPFIENWMNKNDGTLPQSEITYTLENLLPGDKFEISALVRVYSEAGNEIQGATFFVGDTKTDIVEKGTAFDYNANKGVYGTFSGEITIGADGILKFGVAIEEGATFNWVAIKNIKINKIR